MRPAACVFLCASLAIFASPQSFAQTPSPRPPSQTAPVENAEPGPAAPDTAVAPVPLLDAPPAKIDDLAAVPSRVWALRIAGGWDAAGRQGFSRVIGVFEGDRQRLFVQWLAAPRGEVVETKELVDDEAAKLTFGDMRAEPEDRGGVSVFVDTLPDADGLRETWVLVVGPPGDVRFGPATN